MVDILAAPRVAQTPRPLGRPILVVVEDVDEHAHLGQRVARLAARVPVVDRVGGPVRSAHRPEPSRPLDRNKRAVHQQLRQEEPPPLANLPERHEAARYAAARDNGRKPVQRLLVDRLAAPDRVCRVAGAGGAHPDLVRRQRRLAPAAEDVDRDECDVGIGRQLHREPVAVSVVATKARRRPAA
eukprot:1814432-Prymnesium_polylepis.1